MSSRRALLIADKDVRRIRTFDGKPSLFSININFSSKGNPAVISDLDLNEHTLRARPPRDVDGRG
jgi:hypothetical protein